MNTIINRLENKCIPVTESGCWIWTGASLPKGYGIIRKGKKSEGTMLAHRASYQSYIGEIPEGLNVLHRCDVPSCINPDHLFLGTTQDNVDDKVNKNRQSKGSGHGRSKLTNDQVLAIRTDIRPHKDIAKDYGLSRKYVNDIKSRRYWKCL